MSKPMRWLLVDDDADDRDIFLMSLKKTGKDVNCDIAKDGLQALQKLESGDTLPDCIILDLNMPLMDGRTCLSEIKKNDRLKDIPVFIYSTSSEPSFIAELKNMGAVDYIIKPSSLSALMEVQADLYYRLVEFVNN